MIHHIDTPIARIGSEIRRVCDEERLSYKDVAERCNQSIEELFQNQKLGPITVSRITKIVQAYQQPDARGVAKKLEAYELVAIPHALGFSLDKTFGLSFRRHALIWDPTFDPEYSETILRLLEKHGARAQELFAWAEFLPCSMETPEFMEAHHLQLFRTELNMEAREWRQMMSRYNEFGHRRRVYVLSPRRPWRMKQLMLVSDLERIVYGQDEFDFAKQIRRQQIEYLCTLISDPSNRMELILADDKHVASMRRRMRDYDCQFMLDELVTVWRSHSGKLSWSEDRASIAQHRAVLEEFERLSTYKAQSEVWDLLRSYMELVK